MSGIWTEEDLRTTVPFEEIDIDSMDDASSTSDLLAALPDDPPIETEPTTDRLTSVETYDYARRNVTPPYQRVNARNDPARVYDEITAVRENPLRREERQWLDVHAVVDEQGRLQLPPRMARRLAAGSVVEIRVASWALPDE